MHTHQIMKITRQVSVFSVFVFVLLLPAFFLMSSLALAASHKQTWVRLDRLTAGATTGGTVCIKTAVADVTEANVAVTFPGSFTVNGTASNWTTTTTNLPSGALAWLGIGTATNVSTQTVTFPSSDLATDTLYCFNFTGTTTLTNSTAGNDKVGTVASGGNSSSYALSIVSSDSIVISATVPATFTFSLPTNTDSFVSNLSTAVTLTSGSVATISTNAAAGWVAWVKSANAALNSVSTGATIATAGAVDNAVTDASATDGYFLDVAFTDHATGTGTVTQAANYGQEYDGDATHGGTLSTSFQPVAASSGTTAGDTLTFKELARISAVQAAAADYTDTLTVVAAGRF